MVASLPASGKEAVQTASAVDAITRRFFSVPTPESANRPCASVTAVEPEKCSDFPSIKSSI